MEAIIQPLHSAATPMVDEVEHFASLPPLTDEVLLQYSRRTTKRPAITFAAVIALPFIAEGICQLLGV
jgi:hypothetical protein